MIVKPFQRTGTRICSRCVMDDTATGITFDANDECTFCKIQDELEAKYPPGPTSERELAAIVARIKKEGQGKKYDCVIGVSGGRDSSYTLYMSKKLGLRPLAVHFDNGWNSEHAVSNIKNICQKLQVDLHTVVADWEEFKDLQRSFLFASVPDAEVPTDWVIFSVLFKEAASIGVKYVIHGHSFRTEGTTPLTWTYMDGRYVNDVHRRFGSLKIRSFPVMKFMTYLYYTFVKKIRQVRLLYYLPYNEQKILEMLQQEVAWKDYGGKHHESKYTGFFQSYILTRKFGIDKRKLHYSALIRSKQMERAAALAKLERDPYDGGSAAMEYCLKKLDLSADEFEKIMSLPRKSFLDYRSYYSFVKRFQKPTKWGVAVGIIPDTVYRKYFMFSVRKQSD